MSADLHSDEWAKPCGCRSLRKPERVDPWEFVRQYCPDHEREMSTLYAQREELSGKIIDLEIPLEKVNERIIELTNSTKS